MNEKKPLSEARKQANKKYLSKFAEMRIRVMPEERDAIQNHATTMNESASAFIKRAIDETMARDCGKKY